MSEAPPKKKRPGRLWLFFWGRKRRGFPGLLVAIVVTLLVLGALYGRLPDGAELSRWFYAVTFTGLLLVIIASFVLVVIGFVRPPRGRRSGRRQPPPRRRSPR